MVRSHSNRACLMRLNDYQQLVLRTSNPAVDDDWSAAMTNWSLGLAGEGGEFANLVKKTVFHEHPWDQDKAVKELGDCLWYIARAAATLGVGLEDVAQLNVDKLRTRYPNGWTREDSINRRDADIDRYYESEQDPVRGFETTYPPIGEEGI